MKSLTLQDSLVLKGLALLFLLVHHLFYINNGLYDDISISGLNLVNSAGIYCKVCVAMFVFISGYGLAVQYNKNKFSLSDYYRRRFTKLYLNYWFIGLIFVPIGVFVFGRSLEEAYSGSHVLTRLFLDFFGIINAFGYYGYNPTWWFYSCIILLYLIFPLLLFVLKKTNMLIFIALSLALSFAPIPLFYSGKQYIITFSLGILYWIFCQTSERGDCFGTIGGANRKYVFYVSIVSFLLLSIERFLVGYTVIYDSILTLSIVLLYKSINIPYYINKCLNFLGKHSMNIFLFHTFIYYYWFSDLIYFTRNPIIIFFTLLSVCIIISILLERAKKLIRFDVLINKVSGKTK